MGPLLPAVAGLLAAAAASRALRFGRDLGRARALAARAFAFQRAIASDGAALLVVGDSLSVGVGASRPAHSIAGRIAQACPGLQVTNLARSGARLDEVAAQLRRARSRRWGAVLVVAGGNDAIGGTRRAALGRAARRTVAAARRLSPRVVVASSGNIGAAPILPWPLPALLEARSREVRAAMRAACAVPGTRFVDFFRPRTSDPFVRNPRHWYGEDRVHPSNACYALCLRTIERRTRLVAGLAAALRAGGAKKTPRVSGAKPRVQGRIPTPAGRATGAARCRRPGTRGTGRRPTRPSRRGRQSACPGGGHRETAGAVGPRDRARRAGSFDTVEPQTLPTTRRRRGRLAVRPR